VVNDADHLAPPNLPPHHRLPPRHRLHSSNRGELAKEYNAEIRVFVDAMRYKLHVNRHKGKWIDKPLVPAVEALHKEVQELHDALGRDNVFEILQEAADVANMAMIVFNIRMYLAAKESLGEPIQ